MLINTSSQFGLITIILHWLIAIAIVGLFVLGVYMVGLDYYSPWYHRGPRIHESIGLLCFAIMLLRLLLRLLNPPPEPLKSLSRVEQKLASLVHGLFYLVIFIVLVSGYLISSAGDKPIEVFNWFTVPAITVGIGGAAIEQQQDIAGLWHERVAWFLILLTVLHGLAAIKHHFIDKDTTLLRMLGVNKR